MLRFLVFQSLLLVLAFRTASQVSPSGDQLWCHEGHGVDGEGAEGVAFQKALSHIQATNLSRDGLQRLLNDTLLRFPCQSYKFESSNNTFSNWLSADNVYRALHLIPDSYLSEEDFRNVTVIVISYLFSFTSVGSGGSNIHWNDLDMEDFQRILLHAPDVEDHEASGCQDGNETICLSEGQLESVLRSISTEYFPGDLRNYSSCAEGERAKEKVVRDTMCTFGDMKSFSSRIVRRNTVINETETVIAKGLLGKMASIIFVNLLSGDCIVESEDGAPSNEDYLQSLFATFGDNDTCGISYQGLERIVELLKIGKDPSSEVGADEEDAGHTHRRRRRSAEVPDQEHDHDHEDTEVDVATKCLSMEVLLRGFQLDVTHQPTLSKTDLYHLCPALLQQATIGCQPKATPQPEVPSRPSAAEVYGFGTLAVGFVSACVVIALVVVRWKGTKIYRYLISTMLGLAVGSLAGDALLHLIPQALGVHEEGADHDHAAGDGVVVEPYVWKALCGCGSLWFYYNLQLLLYKAGDIASYLRRVLGSRKSSSNNDSDAGPVDLNGMNSDITLSTYVNQSYDEDVTSTSLTDQRVDENKDGGKEKKKHKHDEHEEVDDEDGVVHAHSSVAWMITIGDGIHNFADGLAMGAAFATNWRTGIGTTIAIFTHELPHEFGDTAVLLSAGWSTKKVLLFQLLSQATAFIGLYIGISVSENTDGAQLWIAAVAYGMFLYIALADVIPELIHFFSIYSPWLIFITSNLGICIGFLAMLLLAIYEEKISIAV